MTPEERMRITFELHDAGVAMQRERLRRKYPEATEAEIDRRLNEWLAFQPDRPHERRVTR